ERARTPLVDAAERRLPGYRRVRLAPQVPRLRPHPGGRDAGEAAGPHPEPRAATGAHEGHARRHDHRRRERGDDMTTAATTHTTGGGDGAILRLDHVVKRFGGLVAVNDVSFDVKRGEVFALIGPNGAGKTTLFNSVTGLFPPTDGRVVFEGRDIAGSKPHQAAALGIARTFQNIRLFEYMSALDNVRLGQHCRTHAKLWDSLFKTPYERREERAITERARELLAFVGIEKRSEDYARNLAYGQQRRLEIARALATRPHLLLLDEPAAGFTPQEKVEL